MIARELLNAGYMDIRVCNLRTTNDPSRASNLRYRNEITRTRKSNWCPAYKPRHKCSIIVAYAFLPVHVYTWFVIRTHVCKCVCVCVCV